MTDAATRPGWERLHPQVRALLEVVYRVGAPPFHTLPVDQARLAFSKLVLGCRPPAPQVALTRDVRIGLANDRPQSDGTGRGSPLRAPRAGMDAQPPANPVDSRGDEHGPHSHFPPPRGGVDAQRPGWCGGSGNHVAASSPQGQAAPITTPPAATACDGLPARLYRPLGSLADERLPLLVWFHGGGWTVGDVATYDVLCRELANGARCAVLSVDYRLAPEHPFPAAPQDAIASVRWAMAEGADALAIDPERVAVGGDSAGGTLAIVAALALRDAGTPPLRMQLLVYPSTDQASRRASHERCGRGFGLDRESILWFQSHYLRELRDYLDWRASPLRAKRLAGLPPAHLVTAECDPLIDDCVAYAERLEREGVPVKHASYPGMIHGFFTLGGRFEAANAAVADAAAALGAALSR